MSLLIVDPREAAEARERLVTNGGNCDPRFTEMWEGVEVVPPIANEEHQDIAGVLIGVLFNIIREPGLGRVYPGINVSDQVKGWTHNFRGPDVAVYLKGNRAKNYGTHIHGGPDFLAEIISPGEGPYDKFDFYAKVKTREVLLVFRDPWAIELHKLRRGRLALAGRSDEAKPKVLASSVLPLTFQLQAAKPRPVIAMTHTDTGQKWNA